MPEWQAQKLSKMASIIMGQAPAGNDCNKNGNGTPFVKVGEFGVVRPVIREWTTDPKKLARKTDVLLCVVGATCGKINLGEDCAIGRSVAAIRPDEKVLDQAFLYNFLQGKVEQMRGASQGAAQTVISKPMINDIEIPLPPLSEQKRIVAILDDAFEGIAAAVANTEKNLANVRELFENYLNAVFTQKGDGWVEKKLAEFCEKVTVGHVGSMASKYQISGIPFLRSQNILPFRISLDGVKFIDEDFNAALKKSELRPGDVAIVRTGYPGTAAVIPETLPISNCSDLVIARTKASLNPQFLVLFLNSALGKRLVGANLVGAAQKHFNVTAAKNVILAVPPPTIQDKLIAKVQDFATETKRLENIYQQKLKILVELKQSILQKAFAGELIALPDKATEEAVA